MNINRSCFAITFLFVFLSLQAQEKNFIEPDFTVDGKKFGLPEAQVIDSILKGSPVSGKYVTKLPQVAPIDYKGNRVHQVRMDAMAAEVEVAQGIRYKAWTFGGTVPGPVLHVKEGDLVHFTMSNRTGEKVKITAPMKGSAPFLAQYLQQNMQQPEPAKDPMPHSMDFHAGTVAKDDKWRTIGIGKTILYSWYANYPGVYIYHCGTPPVLDHLSMGQYGVVIVSPKEGYPTDEEVDREFAIVQSEFYLKKKQDDNLYEYDRDNALSKKPLIVAFNGHKNSLMENPLQVRKGERIRIYLLNAGPTDVSSNHIIGGLFDVVYYEGNVENKMHGMQTVLLGASNGAVLEWIVPEEGLYVLVDHEFADAAKGAAGNIIAGPAEDKKKK